MKKVLAIVLSLITLTIVGCSGNNNGSEQAIKDCIYKYNDDLQAYRLNEKELDLSDVALENVIKESKSRKKVLKKFPPSTKYEYKLKFGKIDIVENKALVVVNKIEKQRDSLSLKRDMSNDKEIYLLVSEKDSWKIRNRFAFDDINSKERDALIKWNKIDLLEDEEKAILYNLIGEDGFVDNEVKRVAS